MNRYLKYVAGILFIIARFGGYYFYPRNVKFELIQKIQIGQVDQPLIIIHQEQQLLK